MRKCILYALVIIGLWAVIAIAVGVANALTMPRFSVGEYIYGSIVGTILLIVIGAAMLWAFELIKRIK